MIYKANVGCGKRNFGEDWLHFDGGNFDHVIDQDISLSLLPDEYFHLIYSSHLIAYFDRQQIVELFVSWYNKLKPRGILRLATPNFRVMSRLYLQTNLPIEKILGPMYGRMEMNGELIYHKTVWDFRSLAQILNEVGFHGVDYYDHKETEHAQFDDHSAAYIDGNLISLNIQAIK